MNCQNEKSSKYHFLKFSSYSNPKPISNHTINKYQASTHKRQSSQQSTIEPWNHNNKFSHIKNLKIQDHEDYNPESKTLISQFLTKEEKKQSVQKQNDQKQDLYNRYQNKIYDFSNLKPLCQELVSLSSKKLQADTPMRINNLIECSIKFEQYQNQKAKQLQLLFLESVLGHTTQQSRQNSYKTNFIEKNKQQITFFQQYMNDPIKVLGYNNNRKLSRTKTGNNIKRIISSNVKEELRDRNEKLREQSKELQSKFSIVKQTKKQKRSRQASSFNSKQSATSVLNFSYIDQKDVQKQRKKRIKYLNLKSSLKPVKSQQRKIKSTVQSEQNINFQNDGVKHDSKFNKLLKLKYNKSSNYLSKTSPLFLPLKNESLQSKLINSSRIHSLKSKSLKQSSRCYGILGYPTNGLQQKQWALVLKSAMIYDKFNNNITTEQMKQNYKTFHLTKQQEWETKRPKSSIGISNK